MVEKGLYPHQHVLIAGTKRLDSEHFEPRHPSSYFLDRVFRPFPRIPSIYCDRATGKIFIQRERSDRVVFQGLDSIELAMAQSWNVIDQYETEGRQRAKDQKGRGSSLKAKRVLESRPSEREGTAIQTQGTLDEIRYLTSSDVIREEAGENLQAGVSLDSRGRENPNAQLTQVAVSINQTERRVRRNRSILEKNRRNLRLFEEGRDKTRGALEEAEKIINDALAKHDKIPRFYLRSNYGTFINDTLDGITALLAPGAIRFAPYRKKALEIFVDAALDISPYVEKELEFIFGQSDFSRMRKQSMVKVMDTYRAAPRIVTEDHILPRLRGYSQGIRKVLDAGEQVLQEEFAKRAARLASIDQ